MHGWKEKDSVNNIRYRMYRQSGAKITCEKLPPREDVLQLHIEGELSSVYMATKFISTIGLKRPFPKSLVS